jgi:beta-galactosidase
MTVSRSGSYEIALFPFFMSSFILFSSFVFCVANARTFTVDYNNNRFLKDGEAFRYASGSIHYSRVPSALWRDRLMKMRAGGLNAIQTYVPWNFHETSPGVYNFRGDRNISNFLEIAQASGLLVILRAGPYICGEWEFGGFPSWLLKDKAVVYRSNNAAYLSYVDPWMSVLLKTIKPYLYQNGGPIIMVQVENEYGSYGCDHDYIDHLISEFRAVLGPDIVLFSTDGCSSQLVKCGSSPKLFSTIDFGVGSNPASCFKNLRTFQSKGPLVNSEFYTGWLDHWGDHMSRVDSKALAKSLDNLLSYGNSSVNMYMFEGGTNFGFWNGANAGGQYQPSITSYDYNAPLTEAGDTWEKFDLVKQVLFKHIPLPPAPLPPNTPKTAYGDVKMTEYCSLFDAPSLVSRIVDGNDPVVMEELDQSYGYVMYQLHRRLEPSSPYSLTLRGVHDRAYVFVDRELQSIVQRENTSAESFTVRVEVRPSSEGRIDILVENQGRICYVPPSQGGAAALANQLLNDQKGILNGVLLNDQKLEGWTSSSIPMNSSIPSGIFESLPSSGTLPSSAVLFRGVLSPIPKGTSANDTYLMMTGWTKGIVFINDINIGRYWPVKPPQKTLYVPSSALNSDGLPNTVVIFEQDSSPCRPPSYSHCFVSFIGKPIFT